MITEPARDCTHRVYFLRDAEGTVIYIGRTGAPERRMKTHAADSPFWPEVAQVDYSNLMPQHETVAYEQQAIYRERPRHNVAGNPDRDPKLVLAIERGVMDARREFDAAETLYSQTWANAYVSLSHPWLTPRSRARRSA